MAKKDTTKAVAPMLTIKPNEAKMVLDGIRSYQSQLLSSGVNRSKNPKYFVTVDDFIDTVQLSGLGNGMVKAVETSLGKPIDRNNKMALKQAVIYYLSNIDILCLVKAQGMTASYCTLSADAIDRFIARGRQGGNALWNVYASDKAFDSTTVWSAVRGTYDVQFKDTFAKYDTKNPEVFATYGMSLTEYLLNGDAIAQTPAEREFAQTRIKLNVKRSNIKIPDYDYIIPFTALVAGADIMSKLFNTGIFAVESFDGHQGNYTFVKGDTQAEVTAKEQKGESYTVGLATFMGDDRARKVRQLLATSAKSPFCEIRVGRIDATVDSSGVRNIQPLYIKHFRKANIKPGKVSAIRANAQINLNNLFPTLLKQASEIESLLKSKNADKQAEGKRRIAFIRGIMKYWHENYDTCFSKKVRSIVVVDDNTVPLTLGDTPPFVLSMPYIKATNVTAGESVRYLLKVYPQILPYTTPNSVYSIIQNNTRKPNVPNLPTAKRSGNGGSTVLTPPNGTAWDRKTFYDALSCSTKVRIMKQNKNSGQLIPVMGTINPLVMDKHLPAGWENWEGNLVNAPDDGFTQLKNKHGMLKIAAKFAASMQRQGIGMVSEGTGNGDGQAMIAVLNKMRVFSAIGATDNISWSDYFALLQSEIQSTAKKAVEKFDTPIERSVALSPNTISVIDVSATNFTDLHTSLLLSNIVRVEKFSK